MARGGERVFFPEYGTAETLETEIRRVEEPHSDTTSCAKNGKKDLTYTKTIGDGELTDGRTASVETLGTAFTTHLNPIY